MTTTYLADLDEMPVSESEIRRTPAGQPDVAMLVLPGDMVSTSYGTGPYRVLGVSRYEWRGWPAWSLSLRSPVEGGVAPNAWINDLVAEDGRLRKLFRDNDDEVWVIQARPRARFFGMAVGEWLAGEVCATRHEGEEA